MSEQNKQIARRFASAFAAGDTAVLEEIVSAEFVDHYPPPGQGSDRQALIDAVAAFRTGFPDMEITVERQVAEGDLVAQCGMIKGTHNGAMMGVPATGKGAAFAWMDMYRIQDGEMVEVWHVEDIAGMLQQLGLTPS
jgi:steroid delta-isomerase-like uncharacterized protein